MFESMSEQQQQTYLYFNDPHNEWLKKNQRLGGYSIIDERDALVMQWASEKAQVHQRALDLGCGNGHLLGLLSPLYRHLVGIDFSPQMIALCRRHLKKEPHAQLELLCQSVLDWSGSLDFDLIVANGLIEYLSYPEIFQLLKRASSQLAFDGKLVLHIRNRLYNAKSGNEFTHLENKWGCLEHLQKEIEALNQLESWSSLLKIEGMELQEAPYRQPNTGVGVRVRHQFSLKQIAQALGQVGLEVCAVAPCHWQTGRLSDKGTGWIEDPKLGPFQGSLGSLLSNHSSLMVVAGEA